MYRQHRNKQLLTKAAIEAARANWRHTGLVEGECNGGNARHTSADSFAELGEEALANLTSSHVGRRVHRLIAELVNDTNPDLTAAVDKLLLAEPIPGAVRASVRLQVTQMVNVYLKRLKPIDAKLIAAEMTLTGCVADGVFERSDGGVFIDEWKSGQPASISNPTKQIRALVSCGYARWGERFAGVRRCSLLIPTMTLFYVANPGVVATELPEWLEVRS